MGPIRVLIVDDHILLAEGLRALLQPRFEVVGILADARVAMDYVVRLRPDLLTLDIGMSGMNGLELARRVRKLLPRVKLVFVTQHIELPYLQAALQGGADAYVSKQSASNELLLAVDAVLQGKRYITPLLREAYNTADPASFRADPGAKATEPLTQRQREVLQLIAEGHSNKSIAELLNISLKTVEFHKKGTMAALGLHTTAELTRYAVAQGIITA